MSIHIGAQPGDIADVVLLPGDPFRARHLANTMLENVKCYTEVRGMYGFTGLYKGAKVSVQGTGMGLPSLSIYVNELIQSYGVKKLIRIGTCGSLQPHITNKDLVMAMSACTDSAVNKIRFQGRDYAPTASFDFLRKAYDIACEMGIKPHVGSILSFDTFYNDDPDPRKIWRDYGVLAVDMETTELYTLAAKYGLDALSILTVSDNTLTKERASSEEREKGYTQMMEIALELAIKK